MPEAGLACHSRLISACGVAVPEQKALRLLRALCAVESSDIRMVQAKVIRINTYRNALRIRLQLLLESTLTGPLASVENKELTETLTPLDATLTKNIGGRPGYG
jgi:hypothetical protein